jgi:hypothetical protein
LLNFVDDPSIADSGLLKYPTINVLGFEITLLNVSRAVSAYFQDWFALKSFSTLSPYAKVCQWDVFLIGNKLSSFLL